MEPHENRLKVNSRLPQPVKNHPRTILSPVSDDYGRVVERENVDEILVAWDGSYIVRNHDFPGVLLIESSESWH